MNYIIFLLIFLTILGVGCAYIGWRLLVPMALNYPWNLIAWSALIILFIIPPIPLFLQFQGYSSKWLDRMFWFGYLAIGFISIVFTIIIMRDLGWLTSFSAQKAFVFVRSLGASTPDPPMTYDPVKRLFLLRVTNLGMLLIAVIVTAYGVFGAVRRPKLVEVTIPLAHLPPELDGLRIAQFSDLHVSPTIKRGFVQKVVRQVNELAADVIVFSGDLVDGTVANLRDDVAPVSELSAPLGKFFVTGNHEYYSGAKAWIEEARRLGFTVLMNEHRLLKYNDKKILLAGVPDYTGKRFIKDHASSPAMALQGADSADVKILLAHQPINIHEAAQAGFDLQISGHTHGGQFFPWNFLAALAQPYLKGLHKHRNTWIYVSQGTGYWGPPLRLFSRSEIVLFTLRRQGGERSPGRQAGVIVR